MNLLKFLLDNWVLILAALTSGALLAVAARQPRQRGGGAVSTTEAVRLINREKAVLIDVSEPAEFAAGHAAGARNVPLGSLRERRGPAEEQGAAAGRVCADRRARAARAAATLRKLGYENAHALAGGLAAWREANLPVEKSA